MRINDGKRYRTSKGEYPFELVGYDATERRFQVRFCHNKHNVKWYPQNCIVPYKGKTIDEVTKEFERNIGVVLAGMAQLNKQFIEDMKDAS